MHNIINASVARIGAVPLSFHGERKAEKESENNQEKQMSAPLFRLDGFPMPVGPVVIFSDENGRQTGILIDLNAVRENRQTSRVWEAIQRREEPALDGMIITVGQVTIIKSPQGGLDEYIIVRMD